MLNEDEIKALTTIRDLLNTYQSNPTNSQGLIALKKMREINAAAMIENVIEDQKYRDADNDDKVYAQKYREILGIVWNDAAHNCQPRA